jgi:hypothetical protein
MNQTDFARFLALALVMVPPLSTADAPKCDGTESWATSMAFVHLKNAGMLYNETTDFSKTRTTRIASEKIGKDLYRQVHRVTFIQKSGSPIEVITVNDASHEECSMGGVEVFVISKELGGLNR